MSDFKWEKKGLLVEPSAGIQDFTHASHPCIQHIKDDKFLLIWSMRDSRKRSHVFRQTCLIKNGEISTLGDVTLAMSPGKMGTFDCEGLLSCCPVRISKDKVLFYYSGWNNYAESLWLCDTGLAEIDLKSLKFNRVFEGPVMGRDRHNPYFAAGTSVILEDGLYRSWYNSGLSWQMEKDGSWKARYGVHYAESHDGIDWKFFPGVVIPFKDANEHSFGRPTVLPVEGQYHMWFSCRGANGNPEYRIGYAISDDGITWQRVDESAGISVSDKPDDFDHYAQAYPFPFQHDGTLYLLYNGNNYGLTGFGYAVLERK